MGRGNGRHDGQAETVPISMAGALSAELLNGSRSLPISDSSGMTGPLFTTETNVRPSLRPGPDLDLSVLVVVADGVVEQIGDQPLGKPGITERGRRLDAGRQRLNSWRLVRVRSSPRPRMLLDDRGEVEKSS